MSLVPAIPCLRPAIPCLRVHVVDLDQLADCMCVAQEERKKTSHPACDTGDRGEPNSLEKSARTDCMVQVYLGGGYFWAKTMGFG